MKKDFTTGGLIELDKEFTSERNIITKIEKISDNKAYVECSSLVLPAGSDSVIGAHTVVVGYYFTVGKAGRDTWVGNRWDGTIWNQYLEPRFEIEWADLSRGRGNWYTSLEEGRRAQEIQHARYGNRPEAYASEELGTAYKSAALRWVKRQPRMKTCRLEDITAMRRIRRVSHDGKYERYFEIEARGQKLTLGR